LASNDPNKWQALLKKIAKLPEVAQTEVLKWLEEIDPAELEQDARTEIWDAIRHLVHEHRFFHDAWWALPQATVAKLAALEQKFTPGDPVHRAKWLFGRGGYQAFGDSKTSHEERERIREDAQSEALRAIFQERGLDGVLEIAFEAAVPQAVGALTASL